MTPSPSSANGQTLPAVMEDQREIDQLLVDATGDCALPCVKAAVAAGANIDAVDPIDEDTCLHKAIGNAVRFDAGRDVVEFLIESGADLNRRDANGETAFERLVNNDNAFAVLALQIGHPADSVFLNGGTALFVAAGKGNASLTRSLLAAGASHVWRDGQNQTPLHVASTAEVVDILIDAGADVMVESTPGFTPIISAVWLGHLDAVRSLLARGASANRSGENESGPLVTAIAVAQSACPASLVEILCDAGANLEERNSDDSTPLLSAAYRGYTATCVTLATLGANLEARNRNGDTPVLVAAERRKVDAMLALLNAGSDSTVRNDQGLGLAEIAESRPEVKIALTAWRARAIMRATPKKRAAVPAA
jgi:ankyrin repeat protein